MEERGHISSTHPPIDVFQVNEPFIPFLPLTNPLTNFIMLDLVGFSTTKTALFVLLDLYSVTCSCPFRGGWKRE